MLTKLDELIPSRVNTIAIAVSGGIDSLALTLLTHEWAKRKRIKLYALTVDHRLRKESANESKQVHKWLSSKGIKHYILTAPRSNLKVKSNREAFARNLRYGLINDWCKKNKVTYVLVAHNLEDQAETFLIRLARGSGLDGLCAMSEITELKDIVIVRPLLDISRKELKEYLESIKQDWIEDASNQDKTILRNRLRHHLKNAMQEGLGDDVLIKRLAETAKSLQRARSVIEKETNDFIKKCNISRNKAVISLNNYLTLPEEIGLRVLSKLLLAVAKNEQKVRFVKLERLYLHIVQKNSMKVTLGGCIIKIKANELIITKEP